MDEIFILSDEIKRFAKHLTNEIKSPQKRQEVTQEYIEHLEDAIYHYSLQGLAPKGAFRKACDDIGNTTRIQTLLATVHNKDRFPSWIKRVCILIASAEFLLSPFVIKYNENYIKWYNFIIETAILVGICFAAYNIYIFVRAIYLRATAIKKLKTYAKQNGHRLSLNANPYLSILKFPK